MTTHVQIEAASAYLAQATSAALFPPASVVPKPARPLRQRGAPAAKVDNRLDVPLSELTFRHLQGAGAISSIAHLRKEIQLVAAGVADPGFVAREKKETRRALWPLSSAAAPASGRFA